jgi:hypothetical protein
MICFKGRHFPKDIILMAVRWYVAYPLSYRNIEELMAERNIKLDHSAVQKWVVQYSPQLESSFRKRKKMTGDSVAKVPPQGPFAKPIHYMLTHWKARTHYLDDGRLEIDNNSVLYDQVIQKKVYWL